MELLTLDQPGDAVEVKLNALTEPADAKPVDWVLLCTGDASDRIRGAVAGSAVHAVHSRRGFAKRHRPCRARRAAGGTTVLPVIVYYNGERLAPDRVRLRQGSDQDLAVADDDAGRGFAVLFEGTPLRILRSHDFATLIWRKR